MSSSGFVNGSTLTDADWFNDTDTLTYMRLTSVSGTNTIVGTGPVSMTAYETGQIFTFIPANTTTGATTLNITPSGSTALGAKNVYANNAACIGGEIRANIPVAVFYDGTQFQILSSGTHMPSVTKAAFLATHATISSNATGDGTEYTVICDTEVFDQGANYNPASGVFTAPVTGRYRFTALQRVSDLVGAHNEHLIKIVTSNRTYSFYDNFTTNPFVGNRTLQIACLADMDAADTAYVVVAITGSTKIVDVAGDANTNFFCGELVA